MPSPFPGMDPWLESEEIFPDLHATLVTYLREAINAALPPGYFATTKTNVWIDDVQRREPDVSVLGENGTGSNGATLATLPGLRQLSVALGQEEHEEPYLEIQSPTGQRLVTAVEILSLSNKVKHGPGRIAYQDKQAEFRLGGVNLVEIDLLRGGVHTSAVPRECLEQLSPGFRYHVVVTVRRPRTSYFGVALQLGERLPAIGIPLDVGVEPITVDLQPLLDRAYDTGRYARRVDYARGPYPPLSAQEQVWAAGLLGGAAGKHE